MADTSRFWDRMAARYARSPIADEATYQRKLEITRKLFRPDMEILEIGCGTGSTAIAHAPHVGHILAIDISRNMLAIARQKAEAAGVRNIEFRRAEVDRLDLADESFDMALANSILHLVEDRDRVLGELFRVLKPGGWLVSSTACIGDGLLAMKWIAPIGLKLGLLPQLRVFSRKQLLESITRAGFSIEQQWKPEGRKLAAVFVVARKP